VSTTEGGARGGSSGKAHQLGVARDVLLPQPQRQTLEPRAGEGGGMVRGTEPASPRPNLYLRPGAVAGAARPDVRRVETIGGEASTR
jgi:hypothetical protein